MQKGVKTAFFGSDPIVLPLLDYLYTNNQIDLKGIFTQPDKPVGRGKKIQPNSVKTWASEKKIPVLQPEKPSETEVEWLEANQVELILVMAYGHILRKNIIQQPSLGIYNYHASLLPLYRGACPIEASILMGDKKTGVSFMEIVAKMDAGAVADQEIVDINNNETTATLRDKIAQACIPLTKRVLPSIIEKSIILSPQDEEKVSYTRKITKNDGYLDFKQSATKLECKIRAFSQWPGSFFDLNGDILKIGEAKVVTLENEAKPGELVYSKENTLIIGTGHDGLEILQMQKPGGKMLPIKDFLRGYKIDFGSVIETPEAEPLVHKP